MLLHIILGILKVIGIILGILLLILLSVLLAVLFIPVRYKIEIDTTKKHAQVKVSWLLHIVTFYVTAELPRKISPQIKILGFQLPFFREKMPKETVENDKDVKAETDIEISSENQMAVKSEVVAEKQLEIKKKVILEEQPEIKKNAAIEEWQETEIEVGSEDTSESDIEGFQQAELESDQDTIEKNVDENNIVSSIWSGIRAVISRLIHIVHGLFNRVFHIAEIISQAPELARKTKHNIKDILAKPEKLRNMAEQLDAFEVLQDVFDYLKNLIRHYIPRRYMGYVKIGTGDPASSAQITGLIYCLLPYRADRFEIQTEFYDPVFEMNLVGKGYIRTCHVLNIGLKALFNKKLMRMVKVIRKRK